LPDLDRGAYLAEIAAMMDGRKQRLGQHAAQTGPAWAVTALGAIPGDQASRHEWEQKAASIGAYREMFGYQHPADPIGPEPSHDSPDQRAAWHEAFLALGPTDGPDVRAMPDGRLWLVRDTYTAETDWAPQHVGKELRLVRLGAANAELDAIRAGAEAEIACKQGDHERAGRHESWAASYRAMRADIWRRRKSLLRPRPTGPSGSAPPSTAVTSPSPPTPSCAAAIPASGSSGCGALSPNRFLTPSARS
jgi:hypothetical protein